MSDTTYVDYTTPAVSAAWLNEINDHVWHDIPVQGSIVHDANKIAFTPIETLLSANVQDAISEIETGLLYSRVASDVIGFNILDLHNKEKTNTVDGYVDKFVSTASIDTGLSSNYIFDSRHFYGSSRLYSSTIDEDPFDNLTAWTDGDIGTGSTTIVASGSLDVAVGTNAARFDTGASAGSGNRAIQVLEYGSGVIPANFGMSIIINQRVQGSGGGNHFQVQADNGVYTFGFRFHSGGIYYLNSSAAEVLLFSHGTQDVWSEYWFECNSTTKRIMLFAGTVLIADVIATSLLASLSSGRVQMRQHGDSQTGRTTDVGIFQLGSSCLPQTMTLVSNTYTCDFVPKRAELVLLLDDVSQYTVLNSTFNAYISVDNGTSWISIPLTQSSIYGDSLINTGNTYIRLILGGINISDIGTNVKIKVISGGVFRYITLNGWALHLFP